MLPPPRRASVGQRRNQRDRQVVDAEVAEIFERPNRLRLARSRQPGEHDERLACTRRGFPRRRRSSPQRPRLELVVVDAAASDRDAQRAAPDASASDARRVMAARPQQLVARGDLDEDRDVAARRHRHPDERHAQARASRRTRRRGRAARIRGPCPTARAARRARRAWTTASTRCRTGP